MEVIKNYQLEKFEVIDEEHLIDSCQIESWDDGVSCVTLYGIDGNLLLEISGEKLMNDEYPDWAAPVLEQLKLI